jgi:hypothetical protein
MFQVQISRREKFRVKHSNTPVLIYEWTMYFCREERRNDNLARSGKMDEIDYYSSLFIVHNFLKIWITFVVHRCMEKSK